MKRRYEIGEMGLVIEVENGQGRIRENIRKPFGLEYEEIDDYGKGAIDALESLMLALACARVDLDTPEFREGLQTALDAIGSNL